MGRADRARRGGQIYRPLWRHDHIGSARSLDWVDEDVALDGVMLLAPIDEADSRH